MEQSKKRDHKIMITDIAISKVPYVEVPGLSKAVCEAIQQEHKELLQIAKVDNNSDEVLSVWNFAKSQKERVLGSESYVNPASSPKAYGIFLISDKRELFYLHNHPSTNRFSFADLMEFIRYSQIGVMSVVTNQGEVHVLCKETDYSFQVVHAIFSEIYSSYSAGTIDDQKAVDLFLKTCKKGGVVYARSR